MIYAILSEVKIKIIIMLRYVTPCPFIHKCQCLKGTYRLSLTAGKKKKKRQQVPKMRWNLKYCTVRQYFGFTHFNLYPSTVIDKNASVCQHAFLPLLYIVKMSVCLLQTLLVWSRDHTSYSYISAIHLTAQTASIAVTWPLVTTSIVKAFTKFVRVLGQLHT